MADPGANPLDHVLRIVTRRARWVLVLVLAITVYAASFIVDFRTGQPRLLLDPSVNSMLPEKDAGRKFYDYVRRLFGSDETLLVALVDNDIFTAENLRRIQRMTERLEDVDGVHHVVSLANALNIRSVGGDLEIEPFIDEIPEDPADLEQIRRNALDDPIYTGNLVSRDGRVAAVMVYLLDMTEQEFLVRGIDEEITRIAEEESGDAESWVTGGAHVKAEMSRLLLVDLLVLVPAAFVVMALVAFVSFRTVRGIVITLSTIVIALLWSLAIMAATEGSLNQVTVAAPPILLVVGFAYAIHIVAAYYDVLRGVESGRDHEEGPVFAALRHVTLPVLLTGLTTAAGFLSLMTSPLGAIKQFGIFSAIGVSLSTLISLTFAPALLQVLGPPKSLRVRPVLALISAWGMTRIKVGTDFVRNFKPDNPVRLHFEAANEQLEGSNAFFVVLETDYRDAFKEPVNLREVEKLQRWLETQPEIGGTTSVVDYLKVISRGFHDNDPAMLKIPDSKRLTTQLLFFGANDEIENFVDSRYQTVSIVVRSSAIESGEVANLVRRIEDQLADLPSHIKPTVTGNTILVNKTIDDIALGQALSLSTAFVIIYAILALLFTSFRIGLIALIPNALPVLFYFGVLGLTGVTLNTTSLPGLPGAHPEQPPQPGGVRRAGLLHPRGGVVDRRDLHAGAGGADAHRHAVGRDQPRPRRGSAALDSALRGAQEDPGAHRRPDDQHRDAPQGAPTDRDGRAGRRDVRRDRRRVDRLAAHGEGHRDAAQPPTRRRRGGGGTLPRQAHRRCDRADGCPPAASHPAESRAAAPALSPHRRPDLPEPQQGARRSSRLGHGARALSFTSIPGMIGKRARGPGIGQRSSISGAVTSTLGSCPSSPAAATRTAVPVTRMQRGTLNTETFISALASGCCDSAFSTAAGMFCWVSLPQAFPSATGATTVIGSASALIDTAEKWPGVFVRHAPSASGRRARMGNTRVIRCAPHRP
jgi:predicted RND superfamily exporter protein